ncbi:hypothetical protein BHE74_00007743 [Ensete ventricosum]|nr:hypothetical protein BHE74_00007743 [Ensete ventricosum]RZS26344.1 hypothetical protein BHM03_00059670 [Ensete ventricosum]
MVLQRWVFRMCASNLASNESLGHQHMEVIYHRGRIPSASTSEFHGGDLIIQRYDQSDWRVGLLQCSHSLKGARQVRGQGQLLIPCSRGGRALVVKGAKEMDNTEANSKYQDKTEG